jgi:N-glycosidase YbiA
MIDRFTGDFAFLSNFHPSPVVYNGVGYPTVEHAYQAAKTLDPFARLHIRDNLTAGQAKRYGRTVAMREDWEQIKLGVMYDLLLQKFNHLSLAKELIDTGTQELIEGNHWGDTYWGTCNGVGENWLGKLLMQVRADIKEKYFRS